MSPEQENAIDQPSVNVGCKETTWWNMFHLLLPNVGGLNILNQPCSPCKSFMTASVYVMANSDHTTNI